MDKNNTQHWNDLYKKHGDVYVSNSHYSIDVSKQQIENFWKVAGPLIPKDIETIFDFGCGAGRLLKYIRNNFGESVQYFGGDICEQAIIDSNKKYLDAKTKFVTLTQSCGIPIPANSVDCAIVLTVFLHITDDDMIDFWCGEINRVLSNKSTIVILDTNNKTKHDIGSRHRYYGPDLLMEKLGATINSEMFYSDESGVKKAHWCCSGLVKK